jgi:hypothetical protein
MSSPFEHTRPDPLSDEPYLKPVAPQTRKTGGIPGTMVIVACLGIDLALIMATTAVRTLVTSELGESMALGAFYGILAAQIAMAAIWLGIMATALYWMLLGMVMFSFTVLALLPAGAPWPGLLLVGWSGLTFTFPFALVRMAGFRIEEQRGPPARHLFGEPVRFPLSRLFGWTFVIAAILGVAQSLPTPVAVSLATGLRFLAVAVIALATLLAVLRPGVVCHPRSLTPFALLAVFVYFGQRAYGLVVADVFAVFMAGLLYILTLAGLLAIYRAAGWRLTVTSGRGWLVR